MHGGMRGFLIQVLPGGCGMTPHGCCTAVLHLGSIETLPGTGAAPTLIAKGARVRQGRPKPGIVRHLSLFSFPLHHKPHGSCPISLADLGSRLGVRDSSGYSS